MALFRFGDMDDMFGQMDQMMNQLMGGMHPFAMNPFGMGRQGFPPMPGFPNMMMQASQMMPAGGTSFYSSSVISYSNDGRNPPQIYEETKMNHVGPNGVREERETIRDSRSGLQKMKLGRHIKDRGHVMERSKNHYTGDEEENNEYINIEEEEASSFNNEWSSRMSNAYSNNRHAIQGTSNPQRLAITAPDYPSTSSYSQVASNSDSKKMKLKPHLMKKDKKSKKPYHKNE